MYAMIKSISVYLMQPKRQSRILTIAGVEYASNEWAQPEATSLALRGVPGGPEESLAAAPLVRPYLPEGTLRGRC